MKFESDRIQGEWESGNLNTMVYDIVTAAQAYAARRWAWEFTLTCIYRTEEEDAALEGHGVHPAWRAVDVRDRDVPPDAVWDVTTAVNHSYTYDPSRPALVVAYSKPHGTGPHVHFQVHPATELVDATRP